MIPITKSIKPTTSFMGFEGNFTKPQAPIMPPMAPKEANGHNKSFLILPNLKCAAPETRVVKISEVCTLALANSGGIPKEIRKEEEVTP